MAYPYSITRLEADLGGVLHGTTINQITNLYGLIDRAASQFLLECDPNESIRMIPFPSVIYNEVYDYAVPTDLKGNKVLDIQPQVDRTGVDIWTQSYIQAFDVAKTTALSNGFDINFNSGLKTIRINAPYLPVPVVLNSASQTTAGNGTWTVGGDASNLSVNNTNFVATPSSLQFDLSGATGTGYLQISNMPAVDLSLLVNQTVQFLYTYLPTGTDFSSINFRFGSSSSNYYSYTATVTQQNVAFGNGWNLLAFPWLGSSTVGTPNSASITYLRVTWNYTVGHAQTAVLLNNIVANLGRILNVVYYSKYMFSDAITGAYKERVTDVSDIINLDTEAYAIFFNLVAFLAMQQQQGLDAAFYDGNFFLQQYQMGLLRYKQMYPSQQQKAQSVYYKMINGNNYYGRLGGTWIAR